MEEDKKFCYVQNLNIAKSKKWLVIGLVLLSGLVYAGWESWTELTAPADGDILAVQDISDTTQDATGSAVHMTLLTLWEDYLRDKADAVYLTLFGVDQYDEDFGTFTGSTLSDNEDAKALFQELETAVETKRDKPPYTNKGTVSSGTVTLDGNGVYRIQVGGAITIAFDNWDSTYHDTILLYLVNGESSAITWPAHHEWPGGVEPTWQTSGVDMVSISHIPGGGDYTYGVLAGADMKVVP